MNIAQDSVIPGAKLSQRIEHRFDDRDERLRRLEAEERELRAEMRIMRLKHARMLGFLEGSGVIGRAAAEVERAS